MSNIRCTYVRTTFYLLEVTRVELREELEDMKKRANNTEKDMTDVKTTAEDTREDTKRIKELIENLITYVSNTDTINAQRFAQLKELVTQFMKNDLVNLAVPTHGELCSICFSFVLYL